ncbi:hypothetical protein E2562_028995 [Oryza meyeriana var. granulata]|uniref:Uncharacterized protein n=1 Tax=Oryza meyeriana var. granulata TaxID=110450 RepID=A0A6G1E375_9ORYZ|nr:hypothetical protein E2562_028995 [Oryza meyeriana var. granulata]
MKERNWAQEEGVPWTIWSRIWRRNPSHPTTARHAGCPRCCCRTGPASASSSVKNSAAAIFPWCGGAAQHGGMRARRRDEAAVIFPRHGGANRRGGMRPGPPGAGEGLGRGGGMRARPPRRDDGAEAVKG